jgi:hypothetical protein
MECSKAKMRNNGDKHNPVSDHSEQEIRRQVFTSAEFVQIYAGLALLIRVGTFWRCGDGLFFEVPPMASDALLTTLHPLLDNMLQTVCRKLQEDSGTGGFDLAAPFSWLEKPRNSMGRDLDCMAYVLTRFH